MKHSFDFGNKNIFESYYAVGFNLNSVAFLTTIGLRFIVHIVYPLFGN